MDAKCENAKLLMQHAIRDCRAISERLPIECAMAALREVEQYCHRRRLDMIQTEQDECSCLLREFTNV